MLLLASITDWRDAKNLVNTFNCESCLCFYRIPVCENEQTYRWGG